MERNEGDLGDFIVNKLRREVERVLVECSGHSAPAVISVRYGRFDVLCEFVTDLPYTRAQRANLMSRIDAEIVNGLMADTTCPPVFVARAQSVVEQLKRG